MVVKCEFNRSIFSLEKCEETNCGNCPHEPAHKEVTEEADPADDDDGEEEAEDDDDD